MIVLVSTHDSLSKMWEPMATSLRTFWPDCPWPVKFVTNNKNAPLGGAIKTGPDLNWTRMMRVALNAIPDKIVLILLEDYWFYKDVHSDLVEDFVEIVRGDNIDCVNLFADTNLFADPAQRIVQPYDKDSRLNIIDPSHYLYVNLQAAIWKKASLLSLLYGDEDPWSFEIEGTKRGRRASVKILTVGDSFIFPYFNASTEGNWRIEPFIFPAQAGLPTLTAPVPAELIDLTRKKEL